MRLTSIIVFFTLVICSCNSKSVFEDHKSFKNQSWSSDSSLVFKYLPIDTISKNNLIIKVRHTVEYEFSNLFLFVNSSKNDTIEIDIANKEGMFLGSGTGDVREIEFVYKKNMVFDKKESFNIEIEQAMRYGELANIKELNHILSLGLSIQKQNE